LQQKYETNQLFKQQFSFDFAIAMLIYALHGKYLYHTATAEDSN